MAVTHGGNLLALARRYQSDPADWLDLSTGVSPFTYPVGVIPESAWNALPQKGDGLETAAHAYYQSSVEPVAVAGSQAAILALPAVVTHQLGRCGIVALPRVGYKEHEQAWRAYQYPVDGTKWQILLYEERPTSEQIKACDLVVVINPNNPSGYVWPAIELLKLSHQLAQQGSYLLVDEAFMDCTDENSLLHQAQTFECLMVLRSVGKFFGLAGARVGFLFANAEIQSLLTDTIGSWTVTGPSRWAVKQALSDRDWQEESRKRIAMNSQRLHELLNRHLALPMAGSSLFMTVKTGHAEALHHRLCQQRVLTRLCDEGDALRFGLPGEELQWQQLERALMTLDRIER